MASSGRIIGGYLAGRGQRIEIEWTQTGNPSAKTSTITCVVYVRHKTSTTNADSARACTADCTGQAQQNWTSKAWTCRGESDLLQVLSDPIVWTVPCDAQGNHEPVTLSFRYHYKNEAWVTASETVQLDRVPLASDITYVTQSVTAGEDIRLQVRYYLSDYWHRFTVKMGGQVLGTPDVFWHGATRTITTERSWLQYIPNAMQGTLTYELETFTDEQLTEQVGQTATATGILVCPDDADTRPAVTSGWAHVEPDNAGTRAAGYSAYIAGITKLKGVFDSTKITTKYGATKALRTITGIGMSASADFANATPAPEIGPVMAATQMVIGLTVTDSRGLTAGTSETITIYSWTPPQVTAMTAVRCDANGDPDELGAYIAVMATGSCSAVKDTAGQPINSLALTVRYRQAGTQNWSNPASLTPGSTEVIGGGSISTAYAYEVEVTATDTLNGSGVATEIVPKSSVTLNFREGGDGACFGGYATQDGLEIDWERLDAPNFSQGGVLIRAQDENGVTRVFRVLGVVESTP